MLNPKLLNLSGASTVSAEVSFISQITRIKQRLLFQAVHGVLLNAALIFLSLSAFYMILTSGGMLDYEIDGSWYWHSIAISVSAASFIGLLKRRKLMNVLIAIDRRLQLNDRLSTAYEYLKFRKKTEFTDLLLKDAATALGQVNTQQLVAAKFSFLHLLALFLFIINMLLYMKI